MNLHMPSSELCPVSPTIEDILDEVSGLTVESPNQSMNGGPRLTLQIPGNHQEDKTCRGTGQKVRYQKQKYSFKIYTDNSGALTV